MASTKEIIMQNRGGDCIDSVLSFKTTQDDFDIEFDILAPASSGRLSKIEGKIQEIDDQLMLCQQSVDEINTDIDCLTNHADGLDYAIAALSGSVTYEYKVDTSGGYKNTRYVDVYATNGYDSIGVQVGRMTSGGQPVARERRALADLIGAGINAVFIQY